MEKNICRNDKQQRNAAKNGFENSGDLVLYAFPLTRQAILGKV